MKTVNVFLTYASFELVFEDDTLGDDFVKVFGLHRPGSINNYIANKIIIYGTEASTYRVCCDSVIIDKRLSRSEAAYCVTRIIGDDICSHIDSSVCILHAASVFLENGMVAFSGASGSGKTSLALYFSKFGRFVGDEYAYLDIVNGNIWHEDHPFQLKNNNEVLLSKYDPSMTLEVEGEPFGKAFFVSLDAVNCYRVKQSNDIKLSVLVYPHYKGDVTTTIIDRLALGKLPTAVLESLVGQERPSRLFNNFIKMSAKRKIVFLEMKYSDGELASESLFRYISKYKEDLCVTS
jgi:hypothetical protein